MRTTLLHLLMYHIPKHHLLLSQRARKVLFCNPPRKACAFMPHHSSLRLYARSLGQPCIFSHTPVSKRSSRRIVLKRPLKGTAAIALQSWMLLPQNQRIQSCRQVVLPRHVAGRSRRAAFRPLSLLADLYHAHLLTHSDTTNF